MADLIGQHLGQYEIVALLGRGGMATVYRARQPSVRRDVAIKVMKPDLEETEEFALRFDREAQTIASLSHPHILKVFDYGRQGSSVYLVMELLSGGSLAHLLLPGPLPLPTAGRILDQIASALDYAHRRAIVHRDLKPQNVLMDEEGNAFLTDFGIAKLLTETSHFTQTGAAMGTPQYMPPEQWRGETVDARSDIYALGIMLYEMLSGRQPFSGDTPYAIMHDHMYKEPPPLAKPEIPQGVEQVLKRALAKDREARFSTAGDLATAFKDALAGHAPAVDLTSPFAAQPVRQAPPTVPALVPAPTLKPRAGSPALLGIGALVILLIVALGLFAVFSSRQSASPAETVQPTITLIASLETPAQATASLRAAPTNTPPATETIALTNTPPPTSTAVFTDTPDTQGTMQILLATSLAGTSTEVARQTGLPLTLQALINARLTQTATFWTDTPTLTWTATPTLTSTATFTATKLPTALPTSTKTLLPPTATLAPTQLPPTLVLPPPSATYAGPPVLHIGGQARVFVTDEGLKLRSGPGTTYRIIENLPSGTLVTLLNGPQITATYTWWYVQSPNGNVGWVVEAADNIETLIPIQP